MKDLLVVELLKLKGSKIWWIITLAPALMVWQGLMNLKRYYDLFTGDGQSIWQALYTQSMLFYAVILFPLIISLVMTFTARLEHAHRGWQQYLSLPVKRQRVFLIKFLVAALLVFLNVITFIFTMLMAGLSLGIEEEIPGQILLVRPLGLYLAALPMMAVLYVVSLRFAQLAVPLGLGIGLSLPAILVANTRFWFVYPWTYPIMAALGGDMEVFHKGPIVFGLSLTIFLGVLLYGMWNFCRRDLV
ncbi:MAG TPA: ABC transporter permease subunit [Clostridia bacterium]|nr:ABC transporter permease subunit [Clostridia bacterium]